MQMSDKFEQIKKLLALGKSTNANESATALNKARKLMEEFGYRKWEQFLNSRTKRDVSALVMRIAQYTEELPYADDEDFQLGILEGVRVNLKRVFNISDDIAFDNYTNSDKYMVGFQIADFITFDFFDGRDVSKIDYDFSFAKEI